MGFTHLQSDYQTHWLVGCPLPVLQIGSPMLPQFLLGLLGWLHMFLLGHHSLFHKYLRRSHIFRPTIMMEADLESKVRIEQNCNPVNETYRSCVVDLRRSLIDTFNSLPETHSLLLTHNNRNCAKDDI